jgi:hypothetical protein
MEEEDMMRRPQINWEKDRRKNKNYIHTYIPLTLYPRKGSRGISNNPPRTTFVLYEYETTSKRVTVAAYTRQVYIVIPIYILIDGY